ncbi:MAG: flagellar basal body-associated FliL family protein [Dinoroseobacter sp.]|nr:flagellar basal body-associated FliL family protein [Dinoroseobacter sp.]
MQETPDDDAPSPKKKKGSVLFLSIVLLLGVGAAAGGYFAASKNLVPIPKFFAQGPGTEPAGTADDVAFVPLTPLIISLKQDAKNSYLRFSAQLEVFAPYEDEVARMQPRFLDVLNGYLQALEAKDIEHPDAFMRMRVQALRRMQVVAGRGRVRDLLITEFVLN